VFPGLGLLSFPQAYIAFQRAIGADRLRYLCIDRLCLAPGDLVLDVGCGPGYYLPRLPRGVRYIGYDTSWHYIRYARRHYSRNDTFFRHGTFDSGTGDTPVKFTAALLMGVLHHLSDDECRGLLKAISGVLMDNGCVISVDSCFVPEGRTVSRWMAQSDRGKFIRAPDEFNSLADGAFTSVTGDLLSGVTRVPCNYWIMSMRP
jgi:SAM-dependent methyltransferase